MRDSTGFLSTLTRRPVVRLVALATILSGTCRVFRGERLLL
jgi:hypothetical protein